LTCRFRDADALGESYRFGFLLLGIATAGHWGYATGVRRPSDGRFVRDLAGVTS
jgi:hypothetical protein